MKFTRNACTVSAKPVVPGGMWAALVVLRAPLPSRLHGLLSWHCSKIFSLTDFHFLYRWNHGNNENDWQSQLAAVQRLGRARRHDDL